MIVILTLLISLVEALLLLPAHLANSKALKDSKKNNRFDSFAFMRNINQRGYKIMNWLRDIIYTPLLKFSLKYRFFSLSGFIVALMLTISSVQGGIIGLDFFPTIASDIVTVDLKMPYGTNEKKTDSIISYVESKVIEAGKELEDIYMKDDERNLIEYINKNIGLSADNMSMIVGFGDVGGSSTASLEIYMLDSEERPQSLRASLLAKLIREKTGEIVGAEKFIVNDAANFGGSPVSISIMSNNVSELKSAKTELVESLKSNPSLTDVSHNDPEGTQEINIKLKEDANQADLNLGNVMGQVRSAFFGNEVQRLQRGEDEIKIWIRFDKISRSSIQSLDDMKIITPSGNRIPLREIASYEIKRGDIAINHLDGKREIQINANLSDPNISAADIVFELQSNLIPEIKNKFSSIDVSFEGQYREANKTIKSAYTVFPLALFLIFTVIGFTFRTYSQPFLLLMLIPFSLTTVAWGHLFHNFPVNVISLLGIIALIGILVNDGLVFISKFNSNLKEGMDFDKSLFIAGRERFRAIFLTSVTTIAGLAPIILEKDVQAQTQSYLQVLHAFIYLTGMHIIAKIGSSST
jgi:multidrug efflux pump subunit AcrB